MRTWVLARVAYPCGYCANVVPEGGPMLLIQPTGLSHPKKRCQDCAGEPVPEDIPDEPAVGQVVQKPIERMTRVNMGDLKKALPFDYKSAQVGTD